MERTWEFCKIIGIAVFVSVSIVSMVYCASNSAEFFAGKESRFELVENIAVLPHMSGQILRDKKTGILYLKTAKTMCRLWEDEKSKK